jgi:hypothetical protein
VALILKDLLRTIICPDNNWKTELLNKWQDIIGSLYSKVRIEKIYDDTLVLGVFHSCWMQELYLLSPLLIKTINEKLDQPHIKQLRFKHIGSKKETKKETPVRAIIKKEVVLTKKEENTLTKIADPALRNAIKAFRIRCYQES